MRFTHHPRGGDADAWVFESDFCYTQNTRPQPKPRGFWLSVDDDWQRWCRDEGMSDWLGESTVVFDVNFENVLVLGTPYAIDEFTAEYQPKGEDSAYDNWLIDWIRVADKYAGIVIAPYQWSRRNHMSTMWYYGWDCASACIWDLSVLKQDTRQEIEV